MPIPAPVPGLPLPGRTVSIWNRDSASALSTWVESKLDEGRTVVVLGEPKAFRVGSSRLAQVDHASMLHWGLPDPALVAELFLRSMGAGDAPVWTRYLGSVLGDAQQGFPRGVVDAVLDRMAEDATKGHHPAAAVGGRLRLLLESLPGIRVALAGQPPPRSRGYFLPIQHLHPSTQRLAGALAILSAAALTRYEKAPVLILRFPAYTRGTHDEPLLWALDQFHGNVVVTCKRLESIWKDTRYWLLRASAAPMPGRRSAPAPTPSRPTTSAPPAAVQSPPAIHHPGESSPPSACTYDAATARENLWAGWLAVQATASAGSVGTDHVTLEDFAKDLHAQLHYLGKELADRSYAPVPLRRAYLLKPNGEARTIGVPAVRDRVAQQAVLRVLTPVLDPLFLPCSYGFRPGRNAHQAIRQVERWRDEGLRVVVNADIRHCFDTLDHRLILERFNAMVPDPELQGLIRAWITVPATEEGIVGPRATLGVPQGAPISPLLANLYLHPLDVFMAERGHRFIRYADDFICMTATTGEAETALAEIRSFIETDLRLALKEGPSGIATFAEGFEFLGFVFHGGVRSVVPARIEAFKRRTVSVLADPMAKKVVKLRRAVDLATGFSGYYQGAGPIVTRQLGELDAWWRLAVREALGTDLGDLGRLNGVRAQRKRTLLHGRDFYPAVVGLDPLGDREETDQPSTPPTEPMPGEPPVDNAAAPPQDGPVPIADPPPPGADPLSPEIQQSDTSSPVAEGGDDGTKALYLADGYDSKDLREFLTVAAAPDRPTLSTDGTVLVPTHGASLGTTSQQLVVRKAGRDLLAASLLSVKQVVVQAVGVRISTSLLRALAERGVAIHFLDWRGKPWGSFRGLDRTDPTPLRGQLRAFDSSQGLAIAKAMLTAKGKNSIALLRLYARYRKGRNARLHAHLEAAIALMRRNLAVFGEIEGERIDDARGRLLAVEGRIAAAHFRAAARLLGPGRGFVARNRHGKPADEVNALLDYTYGMLAARCLRALVLAGLDPRLGFVHTDAPGKLSLVYDFMEEFRAIGADRPVFAQLLRGGKVRRTKVGRLTMPTRRRVAAAFTRNLEGRCRYRGERRTIGDVIDAQARHLAEVLAKPSRCYRPFLYNH